MALVYWSLVCLSLPLFGSAQNIQITAQPATVDFRQDDLVILCSTLSQYDTVYSIQLMKNNSGPTLANVASVRSSGGADLVSWQDTALQGRATVTGSVSSPQTAHLRLIIPKDNVQCPADFTGYKCAMSAFETTLVTQETNQIFVSYIVQPMWIEVPRVRIVGEFSDTAMRQFPVGTVVQLTCTGQIGSDPSSTIRWCSKKAGDLTFLDLPHTPIHSEVYLSGCQYKRSSTITYNLTNSDTYTQFLCESGAFSVCDTGTARQYLNITIESTTTTAPHPHPTVAFYARMSSTTPLQHNHQTLIFSNVISNFGDGYNGRDGVFTAPLDGVYGFIWVTRSRDAELHLMVNGDEIGSSRPSSTDSEGSISGNVIVHVNRGDIVFLRASAVGKVSGRVLSDEHGASTFTGWIIRTMCL